MDYSGDQYLNNLHKQLAERLEIATIYYVNQVKKKINRDQPYWIGTGEKGRWYHGENPSQPGEPPKKVRGDLQRSIAYEMYAQILQSKAGTNLPYGLALEAGTATMAPRPYLRATLIEEADRINQILSGS